MKKILALLLVVLSSGTLHARGVWTQELIDPNTGLRTGTFQVNGTSYSIGPGADLRFENLNEADLSLANLSGALLRDSDLFKANLNGADLSGADLRGVNFREANLSEADLSAANLEDAGLFRANLTEANLTGANLSGADIDEANLADVTRPDPFFESRVAELEAQLVAVAAERDAAISERDARPTQEQLAAVEAERDARPNQAQLTAVAGERDALLADIQFAFDQVNAAAGGADADLVAVVDPESITSEVQSIGVIAQPLEAFEVNTFDSPNNLDTELGLYDADGNLVGINDDAGGVQSQLNFLDGLAGGVYYLAVGTFNSHFNNAEFEVSSTGPGGEYTLTLPTGPVSGTLEASGIDWYRIEIGTAFTAVQLQPLTELYSNLVEANTSAILERDAAILERDARPTLEEVQDARVGSLVFRADEGANLLDLRFFIQSSENLQDWEITGECNFLLPMDTGKKFLRIALDQE